ncbi:MAG TPA: carboxypeptidase-like regulatory domain-containing protein [Candidatus Acidoferrales bacterium]|nr:carboxypeptidase-like regulatory domain-containing protein [Candidatus Acidoferrales bacterium]
MRFGRIRVLCWASAAIVFLTISAQAAPGFGRLSGVVVDPSGTPQMGASVLVAAEGTGASKALELLTNERGQFSTARLLPGFYTVRVTLAGFLPTINQHIRVTSNLTTLLKIELDSVFTSLDRLRRDPQPPPMDTEEWKWVLRTSSATRPVLQWAEGKVTAGGEVPTGGAAGRQRARGRLELTRGARRPGSVANLADSPATAFSYDQKIGPTSSLLLAGQMSYERSASAGIAVMWLPSGNVQSGPETTLVLRQTKLGPGGPTFRGLRTEHASQLALGDRFTLHYGAEYVLAGVGLATSALRPRIKWDARISPNWRASVLLAARPSSNDELGTNELQSALSELDALPALLWRNGHPVLESGWHEEIGLERRLGAHASLEVATFRDRARHVAVFGRGQMADPDFFQDFFSDSFVYDGGRSNSWGSRVAYRQKFSDDLEVAAVYAWAGALAPEDVAANVGLREALQTRDRHSLSARVSGRVPRLGTKIRASYKWLSGPIASRQDLFGEAIYQLDPYLNVSVRQPLPNFLMNGKWEAQADLHNLLAQGYVPIEHRDGRLLLVPAFRVLRGGVSFQF